MRLALGDMDSRCKSLRLWRRWMSFPESANYNLNMKRISDVSNWRKMTQCIENKGLLWGNQYGFFSGY